MGYTAEMILSQILHLCLCRRWRSPALFGHRIHPYYDKRHIHTTLTTATVEITPIATPLLKTTIQEKSIRPAPYEKFPISPDIQSGLIFLTTDRRLSRPSPHLKISFQTSSNEIVPIFQPIKTHNKLKKTKTFANTEYFIYFFPTKKNNISITWKKTLKQKALFFKTGLVSAENKNPP